MSVPTAKLMGGIVPEPDADQQADAIDQDESNYPGA
jgi:hypothetical protein